MFRPRRIRCGRQPGRWHAEDAIGEHVCGLDTAWQAMTTAPGKTPWQLYSWLQPPARKVKIDGGGAGPTWWRGRATPKSPIGGGFSASGCDVPSTPQAQLSFRSFPSSPSRHGTLCDAEQYHLAMRGSSNVPSNLVSASAKISCAGKVRFV